MSNRLKEILIRVLNINDNPHKIALSLALGVFLGIIPGTGPIASIFLATLFRLNIVACLAGSLLTNTWLSLVTFLLSIKLGSFIMGVNWQEIYTEWQTLNKSSWFNLSKLSFSKIIFAGLIGYLLVGIILGFITYISSLILIKKLKNLKNRHP